MKFLESLIWNSRYIMLIPVLASLVLAVALFLVTTLDALSLVVTIFSYIGAAETSRNALYVDIIANTIAVIDGFLLSAVLFIFSIGIYELFISKLDPAETSEVGGRLLLIKTLDDLKDRLANVILLILIVKFFQQAVNLKYTQVSDIFLLAVAIVLIAGALFLSGRAKPAKIEKVVERVET
jgi:uncharacterized membrane protein YqhA